MTKEGMIKIPLSGSLSLGEDFLEAKHVTAMIPIPAKMTKHGEKYFLVRLEDNSLDLAEVGGTKAKIFTYALMRLARSAEHGDVVVALYNGVPTIKVYENMHGIEILRPRSTDTSFSMVVLTEPCDIKGVVTAILPSNLY